MWSRQYDLILRVHYECAALKQKTSAESLGESFFVWVGNRT